MINKDYKLALEQIEQQLENYQYTEAHENIKWLKGLKPIPLKLNVLEARYYLMTEDYEKVTQCLDNKWKPDYDYDGLFDAMQVYEELWSKLGNEKEAARYHYTKLLVRYMGTDTQQWQECQELQHQTEVLGQRFYETKDWKTAEELADTVYTMSDAVWYVVIQQYFQAKGIAIAGTSTQDWIEKLPNMGWIKEQLECPGRSVIIIAEEHNVNSCKAMAQMLAEMEKQVYLIAPPTLWELEDENIVMADESFRLQEQDTYGIYYVPSFFLEAGGGQRFDNRAAIVGSLLQLEELEGLALIISSGNLANDLELEDILRKQYSRFNLGLGDLFESNISMGWAGDYRKYISTIYNYDVNEWMKREPTCRYSIVIPVRDSIETLRHTLQTCLELDYPKDQYEIVISDNSSNKNDDIYQLCKELDDSRIQYYRTPRELQLSKSFEFAFLQTQGEFMFSIGADDAVLPWALRVLDDVRERYPKEQIIQWHRGFYVWKGNKTKKENQLEIPEKYQLDEYKEYYITHIQYMKNLLQNPQVMYVLPLLYINSGCKREYMYHLLQETGRLWDGISQDIYMGVVNILINNQILNLRYPLTIAGMSSVSIGGNSMSPKVDDIQSAKFHDESRKTGNVGAYCESMTERLLPKLAGPDVGNLYRSLLRAAARGILPETYLAEIFDWKKIFWNCMIQLNARNVEFDKLIHGARYAASWHGEEFLKWFDDTIYEPIIQPTRYEEEKIDAIEKMQAYQEGQTQYGGLVVDASKYGVKNIYEAAQLFCELSGLGGLESE